MSRRIFMPDRILAAAVVIATMALCAGCGGNEEVTPEPITKRPAQDTIITAPKTEAQPESLFQNPTIQSKGYCIQLHSFREYQKARTAAMEYTDAGYTAYIEQVEVIGEGIYYRVRIGSYGTITKANMAGREIKEKFGVDFWVDRD